MRVLYEPDDNISELLWELISLNDSLNPEHHIIVKHSIEELAKSVKMEICFTTITSLQVRSNGYR
jgi:hypothetical protein